MDARKICHACIGLPRYSFCGVCDNPVPPAGVICDELAPITEQAWRSLDLPPAGEEPGAVEGLRQLVIGPYPDPYVEDAHDEYLDEHQSQALWLLRNAGRIETHVTRLQAESVMWRRAYNVAVAERDALKAEVEGLSYDCKVANSVVNALKSELTKARDLITQYQCKHEWIDNGEDLLVCPKCGKEDSDPEPFGWVQTSGPSINRFTQEWDVVEEWSDSGYEWVELFASEAHQSAPDANGGE